MAELRAEKQYQKMRKNIFRNKNVNCFFSLTKKRSNDMADVINICKVRTATKKFTKNKTKKGVVIVV